MEIYRNLFEHLRLGKIRFSAPIDGFHAAIPHHLGDILLSKVVGLDFGFQRRDDLQFQSAFFAY